MLKKMDRVVPAEIPGSKEPHSISPNMPEIVTEFVRLREDSDLNPRRLNRISSLCLREDLASVGRFKEITKVLDQLMADVIGRAFSEADTSRLYLAVQAWGLVEMHISHRLRSALDGDPPTIDYLGFVGCRELVKSIRSALANQDTFLEADYRASDKVRRLQQIGQIVTYISLCEDSYFPPPHKADGLLDNDINLAPVLAIKDLLPAQWQDALRRSTRGDLQPQISGLEIGHEDKSLRSSHAQVLLRLMSQPQALRDLGVALEGELKRALLRQNPAATEFGRQLIDQIFKKDQRICRLGVECEGGKGLKLLLSGVLGYLRNPASHRDGPTDSALTSVHFGSNLVASLAFLRLIVHAACLEQPQQKVSIKLSPEHVERLLINLPDTIQGAVAGFIARRQYPQAIKAAFDALGLRLATLSEVHFPGDTETLCLTAFGSRGNPGPIVMAKRDGEQEGARNLYQGALLFFRSTELGRLLNQDSPGSALFCVLFASFLYRNLEIRNEEKERGMLAAFCRSEKPGLEEMMEP